MAAGKLDLLFGDAMALSEGFLKTARARASSSSAPTCATRAGSARASASPCARGGRPRRRAEPGAGRDPRRRHLRPHREQYFHFDIGGWRGPRPQRQKSARPGPGRFPRRSIGGSRCCAAAPPPSTRCGLRRPARAACHRRSRWASRSRLPWRPCRHARGGRALARSRTRPRRAAAAARSDGRAGCSARGSRPRPLGDVLGAAAALRLSTVPLSVTSLLLTLTSISRHRRTGHPTAGR